MTNITTLENSTIDLSTGSFVTFSTPSYTVFTGTIEEIVPPASIIMDTWELDSTTRKGSRIYKNNDTFALMGSDGSLLASWEISKDEEVEESSAIPVSKTNDTNSKGVIKAW